MKKPLKQQLDHYEREKKALLEADIKNILSFFFEHFNGYNIRNSGKHESVEMNHKKKKGVFFQQLCLSRRLRGDLVFDIY